MIMTTVEFAHDSEELLAIITDGITELEQILVDDEDFCNKDLDATYQTALKFVQRLQNQFSEKLNELKNKLDRLREENVNVSKQNRKLFDDQIEIINQLFCSGKHQQAFDQFQQYQTQFERRTTVIEKIPKLYMKQIDINQYFSVGQPIITPQISSNSERENSVNHLKFSKISLSIDEEDETDQRQLLKPCLDIRLQRSTSHQVPQTHHPTYDERQMSLPARSLRLSARIPTPVSNQSSPSIQSQKSSEKLNSHSSIRSKLSSGNIFPVRVSTPLATKAEGLHSKYIAPYKHEKNTLLTMICNHQRIILLRSQIDRLQRWYSIIYERSNLISPVSKLHSLVFKSLGFIDHNRIYIFTDREFLIYSIDFITKLHSCILLNDQNYRSFCDNIDLGYGGTVYENFIYHIYQNLEQHWILSVLDLRTTTHVIDFNLTHILPDLTRIIHLSINARLISFLVVVNHCQYAVMFCTYEIPLKIQMLKLIHLFYPGNPRSICSVYRPLINKDIYLVNDPSENIIHLLTWEKYLQSYQLIAHGLYYVEENQEILFVADDGIYSISINEHQQFFSKFH